MNRIRDQRLFAFDFGLSGLYHARDVPRLPKENTAPAVDTETVSQVEALFEAGTADAALLSMSVPEIADPQVLEPAVYAAALDDARDLLHDLASNEEADSPIFAEALAVVEAAQSDRALLEAARRALMRA
jgi:hypothetical protein